MLSRHWYWAKLVIYHPRKIWNAPQSCTALPRVKSCTSSGQLLQCKLWGFLFFFFDRSQSHEIPHSDVNNKSLSDLIETSDKNNVMWTELILKIKLHYKGLITGKKNKIQFLILSKDVITRSWDFISMTAYIISSTKNVKLLQLCKRMTSITASLFTSYRSILFWMWLQWKHHTINYYSSMWTTELNKTDLFEEGLWRYMNAQLLWK